MFCVCRLIFSLTHVQFQFPIFLLVFLKLGLPVTVGGRPPRYAPLSSPVGAEANPLPHTHPATHPATNRQDRLHYTAIVGRAANFQVVDRPRPRSDADADLLTNHGGVAVIAAPGINLSPVNAVLDDPTTFEYVCVRISTGQFAAIIVVVYRPGSSAVQTTFFDELSSVLELVATFQEAVYVVDDFNVRLDRDDDPNTVQFTELLTCYGFSVIRLQPLTTLVVLTLSSRVAMSVIRRTTAKLMLL